jgi:putative transposase
VDIARALIGRAKYKVKKICRVLGVARSNQYANKSNRKKRYVRRDDPTVLKSILEVTKERGTYGYPRITALVNRVRRRNFEKLWNKKRVLRVMQINNLILPKYVSRPKRPHLGTVMTLQSNLRWCSDILEIRCWNGEKVFVAFALECHDREVLSFVAEKRPMFHGDIIKLMDKAVTSRFGEYVEKLPQKIQWLSDQGPQYKAIQTVTYGNEWGFEVITTPAYSPESNGMAEAFVKLFKRDYVYVSELWTGDAVIRKLQSWFDDYNLHHPHSALKMLSPMEYRKSQIDSLTKVSV